jgi:hypothetical protein
MGVRGQGLASDAHPYPTTPTSTARNYIASNCLPAPVHHKAFWYSLPASPTQSHDPLPTHNSTPPRDELPQTLTGNCPGAVPVEGRGAVPT